MRRATVLLILGTLSCSSIASAQSAVSTFESIGLTWTAAAGAEDNECTVRYRRAGDADFREGYPLWFDSRDGEYRGSLVHLTHATTYEVELSLSSGEGAKLSASTWPEDFPISRTVVVPETSSEPLEITEGGSSEGYVLYTHAPGAGAVIDVAGSHRCHPEGPQAVGFVNSAGNHVIRYNDIWGDDDHYFNDAIGAGSNFSFEGFPNRDSDIYGNRISHAWDDGIEAEGANENVRIWGNFIDRTYVRIAIASTSVGPLYVFRNVGARSARDDVVITDDSERGVFLKTGGETRNGTFFGGGRTYVFHNTVLQPAGPPGSKYGLGGSTGVADSGGTMLNLVTRNNVFHHYRTSGTCLDDDLASPTNDWDWDLYSGEVDGAPGQEANGIRGVPVYGPGHGEGWYRLDPSSPGFDDGIRLPGFNDDFAGEGPDRGAHEAGARQMESGVDAHRSEEPSGPGR